MLGLGSGAYTPQVQEALTRLGSRLPYSEARDELAWLWGVKISKGGVRHVTVSHGQIAGELIEQEVARLEQEAPRAIAQPQQLVISTDGAMVQLTSGEWREVKTVAFGEFETQWDAQNKQVVSTTKNISYFSRVGSAEVFTLLLCTNGSDGAVKTPSGWSRSMMGLPGFKSSLIITRHRRSVSSILPMPRLIWPRSAKQFTGQKPSNLNNGMVRCPDNWASKHRNELFVVEDGSEAVDHLFAELVPNSESTISASRFYVPDLFFVECGNILWKYVRHFGYDANNARRDIDDLQALRLQTVSTADLLTPAFELAVQHGLTMYDACYAALAQEISLPLITADVPMARKLADSIIAIRTLADL